MITDTFLTVLEESLDLYREVQIVPQNVAYPTSGNIFTRIWGEHTAIDILDTSIRFAIKFTVSCSIRTRDHMIQTKQIPYLQLIDLQEKYFFYLQSNQDVYSKLRERLPAGVNVHGRFLSQYLNTRVQETYPSFFNSEDESSRRESGFLLDQQYEAPIIEISPSCGKLEGFLSAVPGYDPFTLRNRTGN